MQTTKHKRLMNPWRLLGPWALAAMAATLLVACGGGGDYADPSPGVTVPAVTTIAVVVPAGSLGIGQTRAVSVQAKDQNGTVMSGVAFTWNSSDPAVVAVVDGVVTGVGAGSATITASSGGVSSAAATINVVTIAVGSVVIDKASTMLTASGQTAQLTAQVYDTQGAPIAGAVSWTSSAPDQVAVDASGRLTALKIGSAQIFASHDGVRSTPTLVLVATPPVGALLLTDAQVASVGPPLGVPAGSVAGVGTEYEVTLQGVPAPAIGTVVLSLETAPVAGKVVSTRAVGGGIVVRLAVAPLYQLLSDYDIRFNIDLSAFPFEPVPDAVPARSSRSVWTAADARPRRAAAKDRPLGLFKPFKCVGSAELTGLSKVAELTLSENTLQLVVENTPTYAKRALVGHVVIKGQAGIFLNAGFQAQGKCEVKNTFPIPVTGMFALLVMPGARLGLGVAIDGQVTVVESELSVTVDGRLDAELGVECGGAAPGCRPLSIAKLDNKFKTTSSFPGKPDMHALVSGQFYLIAGLDAVIAGGVATAEIVEARVGPKQSFDLRFEEDQAARPDYAAHYELTLEGVIEPGADLKKLLETMVGDDAAGISFDFGGPLKLSESPKGVLSISVPKVRPGSPVDFSVDFDPKTVAYWLLDYNVVGVELYRRKEGEIKFVHWKFMDLIATLKATYRWTPTVDDAGLYEFAALTKTKLHVPLLEVTADSVKQLEVSCYGGPASLASPATRARAQAARDKPLALSCTDTWAGTASVIGRTPGGPSTDNITSTSTVSWRYDRNENGTLIYIPSGGSFDLQFNFTSTGCATALLPNHFIIPNDPLSQAKLFISKIPLTPATYGIVGSQFVNFTATTSCPGRADVVKQFVNYRVDYASGSGPFNDQAVLSGTYEDGQLTNTWNFSRP